RDHRWGLSRYQYWCGNSSRVGAGFGSGDDVGADAWFEGKSVESAGGGCAAEFNAGRAHY
ncbi:hypothetical protein, partial [Mycobacterium bourgelatii]